MKLCSTIVLLGIAAGLAGAASQAEQLYHQAQKAEHDGEIVKAYLLYAEAAAADPTNIDYWSHAQALRPAASLVDASPPKEPDFPSEKIDHTLFGTVTESEMEEARRPLPPPRLQAEPGRRDYDIQGDSKAIWEQVAATLHLKVLFDTDYRPTRPFRFELANADHRDALHALQSATDSFLVPISERLIFVANDNTQKRAQFEPTAVVALPYPEWLSVQELQELAANIRGVLDAQKLTVDRNRGVMVIRDRVTKVRLAEKLFEDLVRPRAQVTIDVEILTTDLSSSLSYGLVAADILCALQLLEPGEFDEATFRRASPRFWRSAAAPACWDWESPTRSFSRTFPIPVRKVFIMRRWWPPKGCRRPCMWARNIRSSRAAILEIRLAAARSTLRRRPLASKTWDC